MRSVVFGGANSLDNYFARKDDAVDWLIWSDEASKFMSTYWKRFDTVIMGRKTYEAALRIGGGASYPGMRTVVFSRTLKKKPRDKVEVRNKAPPCSPRVNCPASCFMRLMAGVSGMSSRSMSKYS